MTAVFWQPDPRIDALTRRPEWCRLHREAGRANVHFVLIHPGPRSAERYGCTANRLKKVGEARYRQIEIARGEGATPIDATLAAFDAARAEGCELDPDWAAPFRPSVDDMVAELVG